jgi:antitoxin component YwqK of YwqJK toxin-antitoxin module
MKYTYLLLLVLLTCTNKEIQTDYYLNSQLMHNKEFLNGVKNGKIYFFKENGDTCAVENYSNGMLDKYCTIQGGDIQFEYYENEVKQGSDSTFYKNGQLRSVGNFVNGKQVSTWAHYHNTGEFWFETEWKNGQQEGSMNSFHPNGNKETECIIINGKLEGVASFYDSTGILIRQIVYEHSIPLDTIKKSR